MSRLRECSGSRVSVGWRISGIPASIPIGTILREFTPSTRIIPKRISF